MGPLGKKEMAVKNMKQYLSSRKEYENVLVQESGINLRF